MKDRESSFFQAGSKTVIALLLATGCTNSNMIAPNAEAYPSGDGVRPTEQIANELVLKVAIDESAKEHIDASGRITLKELIEKMAERMGVIGRVNVRAIGSNMEKGRFTQLYNNFYGKAEDETITAMYGYMQAGDLSGMHLSLNGESNIVIVVDDNTEIEPGLELIRRVGTELRHVVTEAFGTCGFQDLSDMAWSWSVITGMVKVANEGMFEYDPNELWPTFTIECLTTSEEFTIDPDGLEFGRDNLDLLKLAREVYR